MSHPSVSRVVDPVLRHATPVIQQIPPTFHKRTEHLYQQYLVYSTLAELLLRKHSRPYAKQLQQHYDAQIDPYVSQFITTPYKVYLAPAVVKAEGWGQAIGEQIEPYLWRTAATLYRGAHGAQPHLMVLWGYVADIPSMVQHRAWDPLVDLRRTYVDPQVSKMMETVEEVGGESKPAAAAAHEDSVLFARAEHVHAQVVEEQADDTYVT